MDSKKTNTGIRRSATCIIYVCVIDQERGQDCWILPVN